MKTFRDDLQKQKERVLDAPNDHSQKSERQQRELRAYSTGVASLRDSEIKKELDSLPKETHDAVVREAASQLNWARDQQKGDFDASDVSESLRDNYKMQSMLIERDYELYKIDEQGQDQQDHANPDEVTEPEVKPDFWDRVEDGRQWDADKGKNGGKSKDDKDKDQGLEL